MSLVILKIVKPWLRGRGTPLYKRYTVNPLLSPPPPQGLIYFKSKWVGGLFERGDLFNLETTMVSVLHKELEYKVEKLKHKKY